MPRHKRAPSKRLRAPSGRKAVALIFDLSLDMEEPLTEAAALLSALQLIGQGLCAHDDNGGTAVSTIAGEASERLDVLRGIWDRIFKASKGGGKKLS